MGQTQLFSSYEIFVYMAVVASGCRYTDADQVPDGPTL